MLPIIFLYMPIPTLDKHGLLPLGVYDCTLQEIKEAFVGNIQRRQLFDNFLNCLSDEIRPLFDSPIYINGSFVMDKDRPEDVDVVLDLEDTPDEKKWAGLMFMNNHQNRLLIEYQVHFWINFATPGCSDFSVFFQYIGVKTARFKGLNPKHLKGILRIVR